MLFPHQKKKIKQNKTHNVHEEYLMRVRLRWGVPETLKKHRGTRGSLLNHLVLMVGERSLSDQT